MIALRKAVESDCGLLWRWANDPNARASAFSSDLIPWETHVSWFYQQLNNRDCFIFIGLEEIGIPVVQILFDFCEYDAQVDISIKTTSQGSGMGTELIKAGTNQVVKEHVTKMIHAYIKADNFSSQRAFEKAGFMNIGQIIYNSHACIHMRCLPNER